MFINCLCKIMLIAKIVSINKLQGSYGLRKREVFIEEIEITNRTQLEQWNQWPTNVNRSTKNFTKIPKCTQKERLDG